LILFSKKTLDHIATVYQKNNNNAYDLCLTMMDDDQIATEDLVAIDEFCLYLLGADPVKAIEISRLRINRFPTQQPGVAWSVQAAAHGQVGNIEECVAVCREGLRADLPVRMRLNLLSTLAKYEDVSGHLPDMFRCFDPKVDGFDMVSRLYDLSNRYCFWSEARHYSSLMKEQYERGQFGVTGESARLNLLWCGDNAINTGVTRSMMRRRYGPGAQKRASPLIKKGFDGKITLGYLSADFRDHPTAHLMMGCWRNHDRDRFRVIFFDNGWDDKSLTRVQLEGFCDEIVPVASLSDQDASKLIRDRGVDILIELNGPTHSNRLGIVRQRPAPVQVGYLGWPGSYGGELVDYIVADHYVFPESRDAVIPERIIKMPSTYQVNDHKSYEILSLGVGPKSIKASPFKSPKRRPFRFGSINNINKLSMDVWDVWMHILREIPFSELHILHPGLPAIKNLIQYARQLGVDSKRIVWLPKLGRFEHLERLHEIDLCLDSWPYGGHTTTTDALAAGVPVLALEGENFAGRVSGSLLSAAGLGKALIAPDERGYSQIACSLAESPEHISQIRNFMRSNIEGSALFDSLAWTRAWEKRLEEVLDAA